MSVKCPNCRSVLENGTSVCPYCGLILKKPGRSYWGKFFLWLFYGYNLLMALALATCIHGCSEDIFGLPADAEPLGTIVSSSIIKFLVILWVTGAICTGLAAFLTRPRKL